MLTASQRTFDQWPIIGMAQNTCSSIFDSEVKYM